MDIRNNGNHQSAAEAEPAHYQSYPKTLLRHKTVDEDRMVDDDETTEVPLALVVLLESDPSQTTTPSREAVEIRKMEKDSTCHHQDDRLLLLFAQLHTARRVRDVFDYRRSGLHVRRGEANWSEPPSDD
jgi:hypothetical protein